MTLLFPTTRAFSSPLAASAIAALLFCGLAACAPVGQGTTASPASGSSSGSSARQGSSSAAGGSEEGLPSGCESDDSYACARDLTIGGSAQGTFRGGLAQQGDFYAVSPDSPGVLEIAIAPMPPGANARVSLHDSEQEWITTHTTREDGKSFFLDVPVRAEPYYLEVHGFVDKPTAYEMQTSLDTEDPYEYNGTLAEAEEISVGQTIRAKAKPSEDDDFYRFDVQEAGAFKLSIESVPATQRMEAEIYGTRQGSMGVKGTREAGANLYGEFDAERPGTYYLRVQGEGRSDDFHEITIRPVDSEGNE